MLTKTKWGLLSCVVWNWSYKIFHTCCSQLADYRCNKNR